MIRTFHESPNAIFGIVQQQTDGDYCLAHLYKENETYRELFNEAVKSGREVILDNSIFEEKGLSNKEFADLILELKPDWYIIPDVLEDREATIENFKKFKEEYPDLPGKVIGVVQGKNYKEITACYQELLSLGCDKIAISFDYSYYQLLFPKLEKLMAWCQGRVRLIDKMIEDGILNTEVPIHLLGCSLAREFGYYAKDPIYHFIESLDTSNPVVCGIFHLKYKGPWGVETKPSMKLCDMIDKEITAEQIEIINENIYLFRQLLGIKEEEVQSVKDFYHAH